MNLERHRQVIERIKAEPVNWGQYIWHSPCGTRHCYAGWAEVLAKGKDWKLPEIWLDVFRANAEAIEEAVSQVIQDAREWLELTEAEADYLFRAIRTLEELEEYAGEER